MELLAIIVVAVPVILAFVFGYAFRKLREMPDGRIPIKFSTIWPLTQRQKERVLLTVQLLVEEELRKSGYDIRERKSSWELGFDSKRLTLGSNVAV